jgi:hypothetical protein
VPRQCPYTLCKINVQKIRGLLNKMSTEKRQTSLALSAR